jgi:hypothetical protein
MNKRILLGILAASAIVIGFSTAPALAELVFNVGGGGNPNQIAKVHIDDKDPNDELIDQVKFNIKGLVSTDGSQGQIGYALLTDGGDGDVVYALGVTSHDVFYDNVGQGSGPGITDCATGALASATNAGLCTFKLPCGPDDECGPEWHIHYAQVTVDEELCPDGFSILDLTYAQPGNVIVDKNMLTIQNLDTTPGLMLSSLGGTFEISFSQLAGFAPLSVSATIDDSDSSFQAACLTPIG